MNKSRRPASSRNLKRGAADSLLLEIPSELKYIRKVSSEVLSGLSAYAPDDEALFDIRLCVEEASRNAIVHGNHSDRKKRVRVRCWVEKGTVNVEIEDEGAGFDPEGVSDPTIDGNIIKEHGRGLVLIRKLMDGVHFNEKGNKIRMEKRLRRRRF